MSRSIVLLNLCLLGLLVAGGLQLRQGWIEARDREQQALAVRPVGSLNTQPAPALAQTPPRLQASQYIEVAERFLFARDRNPNVVVEVKAPPPPKVMPDLPYVFGVMDVGFGPTVFMSTAQDAQQGYKPGEKIGEFTLKAASDKQLTFEWDGKDITKSVDELRARSKEGPPAQSAQSAPATTPFVANGNPPGFVEQSRPKPPDNVRPAPGVEIGNGRRGCIAGDSSPSGTSADGYRKVSQSYAFGPICYWEPSGK